MMLINYYYYYSYVKLAPHTCNDRMELGPSAPPAPIFTEQNVSQRLRRKSKVHTHKKSTRLQHRKNIIPFKQDFVEIHPVNVEDIKSWHHLNVKLTEHRSTIPINKPMNQKRETYYGNGQGINVDCLFDRDINGVIITKSLYRISKLFT